MDANNTNWEISSVLSEAWQKVSGMKAAFWGAFILVMIIYFLGHGIQTGIKFIGVEQVAADQIQQFNAALMQKMGDTVFVFAPLALAFSVLFSILFTLFIEVPIQGGLTLIGLKRADNKKIRTAFVFKCFSGRYLWRLMGASVAIGIIFFLIIGVGILLTRISMDVPILAWIIGVIFMLGFIYFAVGVYMTIPLVIDYGMGPLDAITTSCNCINRCWFRVFFLYILVLIILLVSCIPFFIGLIWTLPFALVVQGVLYRELFGFQYKDPLGGN